MDKSRMNKNVHSQADAKSKILLPNQISFTVRLIPNTKPNLNSNSKKVWYIQTMLKSYSSQIINYSNNMDRY